MKLTKPQQQALRLIAEWEKQSVSSYCRNALLATMHASYADMASLLGARSNSEHMRREKAWARRFHRQLKPLLESFDLAAQGGAQ